VPSPASGGSGPAAGVVDVVGGGDTGGLLAGPVGGGELLDAGAEGDVLVAGGDCGGAEDRRALVVGLAERVAVGVSDADLRLVPVE
jgi:hypothetical protein